MQQHNGHRARLLARFEQNGIKTLQDYEIVELLLMAFIPRKDTKPIAKTLLAHYKTIHNLLNANADELIGFDGITPRIATYLNFVNQLGTHTLSEKLVQKDQISSRDDVENFLKKHFLQLGTEEIIVLFMDNQNRVIKYEVIAEGTVDQCPIYPRDIFDVAFKCNASNIIMSHNHPGGSANPSNADWELTRKIFDAGKLLGINLLDHIIIADTRAISMREFENWPK